MVDKDGNAVVRGKWLLVVGLLVVGLLVIGLLVIG